MDQLHIGAGNGKTVHKDNDYDVEKMDINVEYSEAKQNLCSSIDGTESSKSAEELYQALSDKNRAIALLKRRLTNQQIQLGYYLHKNLATEAVLEFSNKCIPHLAEDSTQLSLAMYKFIRDTGGKTRLAQLREKLTDYNNRVHKVLLRQEQLIRQGFGFDEADDIRRNDTITEYDDEEDMSLECRSVQKYFKSAKLELCSQLLSITLQVRRELEYFRICAENVVKLEKERNALVDRVFSLPAEKRYGNIHVEMVENVRKPESVTSVHTSISTNTTGDVEGKSVFNNLGDALQDMESEALQLLLLSEKQKNEFVIALEEARVENQQLKERLRDLEDAACDERVIMLQEKCVNIEKEVESMRKELEAEQIEKEIVIKRMAADLENKELEEQNMTNEIRRLKTTVDMLRNERNMLQHKLETNNVYNYKQINEKTSTDNTVNPEHHDSQKDVNELEDLVVRQEGQIKDLLSIMSNFNNNEIETTCSTVSTTDKDISEVKAISNKSSEHLQQQQTMPIAIQQQDSGLYTPMTHKTDNKPSECTTDVDVDQEIEQQEEYHIYYDSSDFSTDDQSNGRVKHALIYESVHEAKTESVFEPTSKSQIDRSQSIHRRQYYTESIIDSKSHRQDLATTTLRVQAFDKDGKSESMHAVLECSSMVEGLLEMNNSSKLHLRLQCTSPQRNQINNVPTNSSEYYTKSTGMYSDDKNISGDHESLSNTPGKHLSREAKNYLSKQLEKIKSQLLTSRSSNMSNKNEIVQNLNEIYSELFGLDTEETSDAQ